LFRTRTFGFEQPMPLLIERGRFRDGQRETEIQSHPDGRCRRSTSTTALPVRVNLTADGEIRWRRDLGAQHDVTIKPWALI
jgi:hypothetical protein